MRPINEQQEDLELPNGPIAAAIVSAAAGCFAMGVFYVLGNVSTGWNRVLSIYQPAGALSGVSTACCLFWLITWGVLFRRWRNRNISRRSASFWSLGLMLGGLLLTFPPVARLF